MKKKLKFCLGLGLFFSVPLFAGSSGFVTPSQTIINITEISLITPKNQYVLLLKSNVSAIFKKTDYDFTTVSMSGIKTPGGRFIGVQVCYDSARKILLNGDTYVGANGSAFNNGATLYSTGTNATDNGSISKNSTTNPTTLANYSVGNSSNECSMTFFNAPACVSKNPGKQCSNGDTIINPDSNVPNVTLLMDLYNSVGVDPNNSTLDPHVGIYPYIVLGAPGAAIHLANTGGGGSTPSLNVSLLFDGGKKLLFASSYQAGGSSSGFCGGVSAVQTTAAPNGAYNNAYGPTFVQSYDGASGKVQFATGNCPSGSTCVSGGMFTADNVAQTVGSSVTVTCPSDANASPPYLGYTYGSGAAGSGNSGSSTLQVARIVDPAGIFGKCSASGGSCGSYP